VLVVERECQSGSSPSARRHDSPLEEEEFEPSVPRRAGIEGGRFSKSRADYRSKKALPVYTPPLSPSYLELGTKLEE
jgi:hypothetical protein